MAFAAICATPLLAGSTSPASTGFDTLYKFAGTPDGATPQGLAAGPGGVLYGTTTHGGAFGLGSVFELQPPAAPGGPWTETVLYSFTAMNNDGESPYAAPTVGANGVLYGTTSLGGYDGAGTVYQLTPPSAPGGAWTETLIFGFYGGGEGGIDRGVVAGSHGELYGVSPVGGEFYFGLAYELTPPSSPGGAWTFADIYDFTGDGRLPAGLALAPNGTLYGVTTYGGTYGAGTVFSLTPPAAPGAPWTGSVIYTFTGGADGDAPLQPPTLAQDGTLYGTTSAGGSVGSGTVFELTPPATAGNPWTETVLYDFSHTGDGKVPDSPLILRKGVIYGTTAQGSSSQDGGGTVFELKKSGVQTILHSFARPAVPSGSLAVGQNVIYGVTTSGGPNGAGTVYRIVP